MTHATLWNGSLRSQTLPEQLESARLGGFDALTMTPHFYQRSVAEGVTAADIRSMAADQGVRITHLDPLATWAPVWIPDNVPADWMPFFDTPVPDFLRMCDELGCESFTAICTAPRGSVATEEFIEPFHALCTQAAEHGLRVDLEFIPIWTLPDLESAWQVVRSADAPNGGIMFDFWHFFRSTADFDVLASIPAHRIHAVQACDALLHTRQGRTDLEDCLDDRLPLGQGEFDVPRVFECLRGMGALSNVGPEYFSSVMDGLTPRQVAEIIEETYWPWMR